MINFNYKKAANVKDAVALVSKDNSSMFIAGGTNLVDLMKRGISSPQNLIGIDQLPLNNIERTASGNIRIGAMALNSDVAENELIRSQLPLLSMALNAGASPQIRNMATTGGNMMQRTRCSYFYDISMPCNKRNPGSGCAAMNGYNRMHAIFGASDNCIAVHPSDMCVALVALDASVHITGNKKDRNVAFKDFHRLPGNTAQKDNVLENGELITAVEIPVNRFNKHYHYSKVRDRSSFAFALVSVAAALDMDGNNIKNARLAMGGVAHKPWRLFAAEEFLKGKKADEANFKQAAAIAMKDAKSYGHNEFKLRMAPQAIVNTLNIAANKS